MNEELMAFPQYEKIGDISHAYGGMTLRDYFAVHLLPAVYRDYWDDVRAGRSNPEEWWREALAREAYMTADAMLKAREHGNEKTE